MTSCGTRLSSWLWTLMVAMVFIIGLGGIALAGGGDRGWGWGGGDGGGYCAPELDPGTSASGLALLVGGCLIALERFRSRKE